MQITSKWLFPTTNVITSHLCLMHLQRQAVASLLLSSSHPAIHHIVLMVPTKYHVVYTSVPLHLLFSLPKVPILFLGFPGLTPKSHLNCHLLWEVFRERSRWSWICLLCAFSAPCNLPCNWMDCLFTCCSFPTWHVLTHFRILGF